jgi:hypothetical protein
LDHYRKVVTTDLDGTFYSARVAGIHWRRQKKEQTTIDGKKLEPPFREGSFVATASMSGHIVNIPQLQAAYNAAKAGVIHLCMFLLSKAENFLLLILYRQMFGSRMGWIRPSKYHLPWLHCNRDLRLCPQRNKGCLERQDSYGERRRGQ